MYRQAPGGHFLDASKRGLTPCTGRPLEAALYRPLSVVSHHVQAGPWRPTVPASKRGLTADTGRHLEATLCRRLNIVSQQAQPDPRRLPLPASKRGLIPEQRQSSVQTITMSYCPVTTNMLCLSCSDNCIISLNMRDLTVKALLLYKLEMPSLYEALCHILCIYSSVYTCFRFCPNGIFALSE